MTDQCKLVFEVENLNNASPATVSRCGQIYISPSDLGSSAVYEGWCQLRALERSQDEANILKKLLKKYYDDFKICQTLEKNIKNAPMMDLTIAWAVGGLYEASERFQFHEYLQSKNCPLPPNKK